MFSVLEPSLQNMATVHYNVSEYMALQL